MNSKISCILSCLCLAASAPSFAQFYSSGEDPASLRWFKTETPHYRIIYPSGLDSLAKVYGAEFERFRLSESLSSGLVPGEGYGRKTPIVLHAYHGVSNGSVSWAPKRADLFTLPDAYDPEPMPWVKTLAVHEGRHIAQMQFGYKGWLRPLTWLTGDIAPGAYSAIWPNRWMLEGDAVVAETALTRYGRGRSADFLNYYQVAFDNGDRRNWYRWRYGSYRHYAPDYYALGYMTIAGMRYRFDDSLFTERYFSRIARNPFRFFNTQKTVKQASGMKFRESFDTIMTAFHDIWKAEAAAREPFFKTKVAQEGSRWFTEFAKSVSYGGMIYGVVSDLAEASWLAEYDPQTGKTRRLGPFSSTTSRLRAADGRLWWSEAVPDERWSLQMTSRIRYYDLQTGKMGTLTRSGRLVNPSISGSGEDMAAVEYPAGGGSNIVLMDIESGDILCRYSMPDTLQAVEACFMDGGLAVSTVSEGGMGIYMVDAIYRNNAYDIAGNFRSIIAPLPVSIRNLNTFGTWLYFSSDRDGTMEMYGIDVLEGTFFQHTSLRYGGDDFCIADGDIFFTALTPEGRLLHRASFQDDKPVEFNSVHKYAIPEKLTGQEKATAAAKGLSWPDTGIPADVSEVQFSEPKRFRKGLNVLRFHSWAPIYFHYDNIMNSSGDYSWEKASAGATALFQNSLGTAWGSVGYSFHRDPYSYAYESGHRYRHSGHLLFTYSGLYPVFEIEADLNDRAAVQYSRRTISSGSTSTTSVQGILLSRPSLNGTFRVYIPFNFSSGGWNRGIIPDAEYYASNDLFDKSLLKLSRDGNFTEIGGPTHFTGYESGDNVFMHTLKASLRGYAMRPTASSGIYPRLGAGAEAGYHTRVALNDLYSSAIYGYIYGYLPGVTLTQGLKITARYQHLFNADMGYENAIVMTPRGYDDSSAESFIMKNSRNHLKITADYAIPVWTGDISCFSPLFYIKNFELIPHFDYTMFSLDGKFGSGGLWSAGADVTAHLANFLWIPYDTRIGVTFDLNGGKSFDTAKSAGYHMEKNYFGFIFSISI